MMLQQLTLITFSFNDLCPVGQCFLVCHLGLWTLQSRVFVAPAAVLLGFCVFVTLLISEVLCVKPILWDV